ncbi:MAG: MFS transporter [Deltaproteobacteria bacterium]|nr:MFS transporter [Deltaproteobacteria bacterium]
MSSLQARVFFLVAATFSNIYLTQPVLPVLREDFRVGAAQASLTVSAVVFGIALATLPFGRLADRFPARPIILAGGTVASLCGLLCAATTSFPLLVAGRFLQGLFFPSLTTCLVVFLVRRLPPERLNVAMGAYVSATVAGGLGGRLLAGFIHPPLHWRYAFVTASVILLAATLDAARWLPRDEEPPAAAEGDAGFVALLSRRGLLRIFSVGAAAFGAFSSVFNYLPFHLAGPPFRLPTQWITMLYLSYLVGVAVGPLAGRLGNRFGNGATMAAGSLVFSASALLSLVPSIPAIAAALSGTCAGFFVVHSAAVGALNRKLEGSRGRANSLYVLFYYLGGAAGITVCGRAHQRAGWSGVVVLVVLFLLVPLAAGLLESRAERGGLV